MTGAPLIITVQGVPVPKGRPRISTRPGGPPRAYTPAKTKAYEDLVKAEGQKTMNGSAPMDGPLSVKIVVCLPIPKSWSKKKKLNAELGQITPTSRPDLDNFIKAALDALNDVAFKDDSQVVGIGACKRYSARPRLIITISQLEGSPST